MDLTGVGVGTGTTKVEPVTGDLSTQTGPTIVGLPPPSVPPEYELLRELGRGAVAQVWLCRQADTDLQVAVKFPVSKDQSLPAMIRNEAVLVNRLRNLGCEQVSAFALQITKDPPGFAYQFVPHTLEGERLLKLPVAERISVFAEMCQSIEALHAIGVCHGDLKPSAFRLTEENAVRLVDLNGVDSKAPRSEQSLLVSVSYSAVEAVDRFWTTLKYMAPEQEQGRATSPQVDVYQLGHLLHIVLTGEELTRGLSPELAGDARQFESVIMKAVRRNPSERYQTVSELREAALAAVAGNLNVNHRGPISGKNLAQAVARIGHQRVLDLQTSDGATLTLNSKGSMAAIRYQSELCLYNLEDGKKPAILTP